MYNEPRMEQFERKNFWIIGAGGEGRYIGTKLETINEQDNGGRFKKHYIDPIGEINGVPSFEYFLDNFNRQDDLFIIALGDCIFREEIFQAIRAEGIKNRPVSMFVSSAINDTAIELYEGQNVIVHKDAVFEPEHKDTEYLGRGTILNANATVCHDSSIGEFCHIGPGATICGNCTINDCTFIGANAVIPGNTVIPPESFVKAGTVVSGDKDIRELESLYAYNKAPS